jgi:hypothetical protein
MTPRAHAALAGLDQDREAPDRARLFLSFFPGDPASPSARALALDLLKSAPEWVHDLHDAIMVRTAAEVVPELWAEARAQLDRVFELYLPRGR